MLAATRDAPYHHHHRATQNILGRPHGITTTSWVPGLSVSSETSVDVHTYVPDVQGHYNTFNPSLTQAQPTTRRQSMCYGRDDANDWRRAVGSGQEDGCSFWNVDGFAKLSLGFAYTFLFI